MSLRDFYLRTDQWLRDLSRGPKAAFFGVMAALGVVLAGLLLSGELLLLRAVVMGLTFFGLEYVFENW